jgi:hypothetical protein
MTPRLGVRVLPARGLSIETETTRQSRLKISASGVHSFSIMV